MCYVRFPLARGVCTRKNGYDIARLTIGFHAGDLSAWGWEDKEEGDMAATCRPLGVEVYSLADPGILQGWKEPEFSKYKGMHGMRMPK
jgi:hypothetical protein